MQKLCFVNTFSTFGGVLGLDFSIHLYASKRVQKRKGKPKSFVSPTPDFTNEQIPKACINYQKTSAVTKYSKSNSVKAGRG